MNYPFGTDLLKFVVHLKLIGLEEETVLHILWECSSARDVWGMANVKFQKCSSSGMRFIEVVEEIFRKCQTKEVHQFAGIVRCMWLRRNEIVHEGPFQHLNLLLQRAVSAAEEFAAIHVTTNQLKNRWT